MISPTQCLLVCSIFILVGNVQVNLSLGINKGSEARAFTLAYPKVTRGNASTEYPINKPVADPYRWLEELDSSETKVFVDSQQNLTRDYIAQIPYRDAIRQRLAELWNYPKSTAPEKIGNKYYSFQNTGLQNQNIMYVQDSLDKNTSVFLDPNTFSTDGTVALDSYTFSKDGQLLAYAVTASGSDWKTIMFKNVTINGTDIKETLEFTKWPSTTWTHDNKGIFYSRYPSGSGVAKNASIYYHAIGTNQTEDIPIYNFTASPDRILSCQVTDDGQYLIITGEEAYGSNTVSIASLEEGIDANLKDRLKHIFADPNEAAWLYITNTEAEFIFETNKDAPNYRLVTVDISSTATSPVLTPFLNETSNAINWVSVIDTNKFLISYMVNVSSTLELRNLTQGSPLIQTIPIPAGSITGFTKGGRTDQEFFFVFQSFLAPGTIYRGEINSTGLVVTSVYKETQIQGLNLANFVTEQKFYPSKDGTSVPMYIVRRKNSTLDATSPTILYGYGGFNLAQLPTFAVRHLAFIEGYNGTYVLANIRGGSEFGEAWHEGGMLLKKQNVFDDFHAAAEYLIKNKYTSASKLTIHGRSNGGLLVGACANQRPDLYAAGIAQVGVMDMLRFQEFTSGSAWCPEYGCSDNSTSFDNLIKYSPLHNIGFPANNKTQQYPALLVTTGDHDERVVPSHSFKYAAELQYALGSDPRQKNPLLLRVDIDAGHGAGKPTAKEIDEFADIYAFIGYTQSLNFGNFSGASSLRDISTVTLFSALAVYILNYFVNAA